MEQEQVLQQPQRPEFLAWVRTLKQRASTPEDESNGRTWLPLGQDRD